MKDDSAVVVANEVGELARSYPYAPMTDVTKIYDVDPSLLWGACDKQFRNLDSRLVPWRFATAFVRATRIAGPPVAYQIAAGQTFSLFGEGEGDVGASSGVTNALTNVETNAQREGGLVQNEQLYFTVGMGVTVLQPFLVTPPLAPATAVSIASKISAAEIDDPISGYGRRLIRAVEQNFAGLVSHGTGACNYKMGPLDTWGTATRGGDTSSSDPVAGQFWYMATPDLSTGTAQSNALEFRLDNPRTVIVRENALNPIPAGLDAIIPIRVMLFGFPACSPSKGVGSADIMRAVAQLPPDQLQTLAGMLARAANKG